MSRPDRRHFTPAERRLIDRLRTPADVQGWLNALRYNTEPHGDTLRSFRGVARHQTAHCLEAALAAATILEQHGYPPLVLSFESIDLLDHVIFVHREATGWGSVARSRDPGLHGRRPLFRTPRALALSYVDPYVDLSGRVTGYAVVDLDRLLGPYDWRLSDRNVWKAEQVLIDAPHRPIRTSDTRIDRLRYRYITYLRTHGRKPVEYRGRERWTALPREFGWEATDGRPPGGPGLHGRGSTPPRRRLFGASGSSARDRR
jgi:hypothetical protein